MNADDKNSQISIEIRFADYASAFICVHLRLIELKLLSFAQKTR